MVTTVKWVGKGGTQKDCLGVRASYTHRHAESRSTEEGVRGRVPTRNESELVHVSKMGTRSSVTPLSQLVLNLSIA